MSLNKWLDRLWVWLLVAAGSLFFLPLGSRALWDSDEGRYAEIAREMLELKDWIAPHLNYVLYFEKPPLVYWLTALSMAVFGQNEFAARFWCAVFGVLTVAVTYWIGKHWKGERVGILAGAILATSLGFFYLTQFLVLDMALTFWMTLALYAGSRLLTERRPEMVHRFAYLFAIAAGFGMLTKGLVALFLPGLIVFLTAAYGRQKQLWSKFPWRNTLILFLVIAAPWFTVMAWRYPFHPWFFFVREHLARYLTPVHYRTEPWYFFIPVVAVGFLPWTMFLPSTLGRWLTHRGAAMKRDPAAALLVLWPMVIFLFFSLSHSKLVGYVLPMFPALALLMGYAFDQAFEEGTMPRWMRAGLYLLIGLFVVTLALMKWPHPPEFLVRPEVVAVASRAGMLFMVLGLGVLVFTGVWGMRQPVQCFGGILLVQVLFLSTLASLAPLLDPYLSTRSIAQTITTHARPDDKVVGYGVSYENVLQTLPPYTGRRVAVFGYYGELQMGYDHDTESSRNGWFIDEAGAYDALLRMPGGTWVITDADHEKVLKESPAFEYVLASGRLRLLKKVQ